MGTGAWCRWWRAEGGGLRGGPGVWVKCGVGGRGGAGICGLGRILGANKLRRHVQIARGMLEV